MKCKSGLADNASQQQKSQPVSDQPKAAALVSKGKKLPAAGQDPLAHYLASLSHVPLFTVEQERENARQLETLDIAAWERILRCERGAQLFAVEVADVAESFVKELAVLVDGYMTKKRTNQADQQEQITSIARAARVSFAYSETFVVGANTKINCASPVQSFKASNERGEK